MGLSTGLAFSSKRWAITEKWLLCYTTFQPRAGGEEERGGCKRLLLKEFSPRKQVGTHVQDVGGKIFFAFGIVDLLDMGEGLFSASPHLLLLGILAESKCGSRCRKCELRMHRAFANTCIDMASSYHILRRRSKGKAAIPFGLSSSYRRHQEERQTCLMQSLRRVDVAAEDQEEIIELQFRNMSVQWKFKQ